VGPVDPEEIGTALGSLLDDLASRLDPEAWNEVAELVRHLTDLYGAGLARTLEVADSASLRAALGHDRLVGPLLALHGLHPEPFEARARAGVAAAVAALAPTGARAQVTEVDEETATVRVQITGHASPGAASRWEALVRGSVGETAPEATVDVVVVEPSLSLNPPGPRGTTAAVVVRLGPKRVTATAP
jgi:hypothetical protein